MVVNQMIFTSVPYAVGEWCRREPMSDTSSSVGECCEKWDILFEEKKKSKNAPIVFIFRSTMRNNIIKPLLISQAIWSASFLFVTLALKRETCTPLFEGYNSVFTHQAQYSSLANVITD